MNQIWVVEVRRSGKWMPNELELTKADAKAMMDFQRGFGQKADWRIRKYISVDKPVKKD